MRKERGGTRYGKRLRKEMDNHSKRKLLLLLKRKMRLIWLLKKKWR